PRLLRYTTLFRSRAHDAGVLVHDDDRARPDHRAGAGDGVLGDLHVEVELRHEPGGRCATRDPRLEPTVLGDTPAHLVDQLAPGDPVEHLVVARLPDMTGERHEEGAGVGAG